MADKTKDSNHLRWIYNRLRYRYNEPENIDYMLRFKKIIKKIKKMKKKDLKELLKYFREYNSDVDGSYYFHEKEDFFQIYITKDNKIYQLDTECQPFGIPMKTLSDLKIRFKSFTGENLENIED